MHIWLGININISNIENLLQIIEQKKEREGEMKMNIKHLKMCPTSSVSKGMLYNNKEIQWFANQVGKK